MGDNKAVLRRLRTILRRAGYTIRAITELLGGGEVAELKPRSPRLLYATRDPSRLNTLIRLFVAGVSVPIRQAEVALKTIPLSELAEIGVLRIGARSVIPLISIVPHDDLFIASDQPVRSGRVANYVPGVVDSSVFLELFTIRNQVRNVLDLGTGCGLHALRASLHADRVTATDVSRRALDFARFNAALNGTLKIEFVRGSGFEPVANRTFDLIVGNLPFVVSPSSRYTYRDSGMMLDDFAHHIIVNAPRHLNQRGYCQLLCQWVEIEDQDWNDRLRGWFDGSGCDVWMMKTDSLTPDAYAEKWIADTESCSGDEAHRLFQHWMRFYEHHNIVAIHSGAVTMRRRDGDNWIRMDEGPTRARSAFGDAVLNAFAAGDYLYYTDITALLDARLKVSPNIYLVERCDWASAEWKAQAHQLRFDCQLEYVANVDQLVAELVARCTGETSLRTLIQQLATATGIDAERLEPACVELVRGLIERGFLLPGY